MKKNKFAQLEDKIEDIQEGAPLAETTIKSSKVAPIQIYGVSKKLSDAINETGESRSNFFKRAANKLAREEGII